MEARRTWLVVVGALLAVLALGLLTGGGALVWAHSTQRDGGWYTTGSDRLRTETFAITSEEIVLGEASAEHEWLGWADDATTRVRAGLATGDDVFIGVASHAAVERYLADVDHHEVVDVGRWTEDVTLRRALGGQRPAPPGTEAFWDANVSGPGVQELRWDPAPGRWSVVVMRADAGAGVDADVEAGLRTDVLLPVGIGLLVSALVLGGGGALLVARGSGAGPVAGVPWPVAEDAAPVRLEAELDEPLSRWRWLVKWLLVLPHLVVLAVLWPLAVLVTVVAGVAVLLTGRYPRPLFDLVVGVLRWTWRVTAYALALTTDRYPPFSLAPDPGYPARLDVAYPVSLSRPLVLLKWWLLALPHYVVVALITGWLWQGDPAPWGVAGLLAVVAGVVLLASGRYPRPVFEVVVGLHRWVYRVAAYALLLRDEYPPFRLDTGGGEPTGDGAVPVIDPEGSLTGGER